MQFGVVADNGKLTEKNPDPGLKTVSSDFQVRCSDEISQ